LVVDAARQTAGNSGDKDDAKHVRRRETIFGPDVGEDDEPGWTKPDEGTKVSVDVVKGWVEKAKNEEVSITYMQRNRHVLTHDSRGCTPLRHCKHWSISNDLHCFFSS
jgi:hypothetical protein